MTLLLPSTAYYHCFTTKITGKNPLFTGVFHQLSEARGLLRRRQAPPVALAAVVVRRRQQPLQSSCSWSCPAASMLSPARGLTRLAGADSLPCQPGYCINTTLSSVSSWFFNGIGHARPCRPMPLNRSDLTVTFRLFHFLLSQFRRCCCSFRCS